MALPPVNAVLRSSMLRSSVLQSCRHRPPHVSRNPSVDRPLVPGPTPPQYGTGITTIHSFQTDGTSGPAMTVTRMRNHGSGSDIPPSLPCGSLVWGGSAFATGIAGCILLTPHTAGGFANPSG